MNTQEVLSQMPGRAEVEQELNGYIQDKRQELQQRMIAYQDSVASYENNKASMSDTQAQQEEQQLSQLQASLSQFQQQLQQEVQQRRISLLQPLYDKMNEALNTVAEDNELDFVLSEATSGGESVIYYSASKKLNITQEVLQQIKETAKN